ncbi:PAS domain-containing protein [Marinobacter sp. C2H3]|uniref:PAS domain-containing protein n=1 Tax=Marinobacter sp. C2H3 TaxID=3119003 RepID=UPI00300F2D25
MTLLSPEERHRLDALTRTGLLDSPAEDRFDRITRIACRLFDVPIALVSLVDEDRVWFKSCQGLADRETPRATSFCHYGICQPELFIVEDAMADPRFADGPLVVGAPHIRFYAGAPVHAPDGHCLGTLCLIDRRPRHLNETEQGLLRDLANDVEREIALQQHIDTFRQLKASERRARAVIEGTRVGTWEWNVQTGETVFNERWAEICGYRLAELEPISIQTWLNLAHPDDEPASSEALAAHFRGETGEYDVRCRMRHKEGHWVWVHDRGRVFEWTETGEPLRMYGTHSDITEDMHTAQRLARQNRALAVMNDLVINARGSLDDRMKQALAQGRDFLCLPIAIVSEITEDAYTVLQVRAPSATGIKPGLTLPLAQTYCDLLIDGNDVLAIHHMAHSPHCDHPSYAVQQLESYIAAPLTVRGRLYGTLNFSSPDPRDAPFSDIDITFVRLLARWLSSQIESDVTTRTLAKLAEQAPGILYQYRQWPDGRTAFPYASAGIQAIYGVSPEDVLTDARPVFDRIHPDDLDKVGRSIRKSERTLGLWQHQYRVSKDGGWRWVEGRASPERLPDNSTIWHGYIVDIDEIKRTQLRLQESEEQLRRLFELSPMGIALNDYHSGECLAVNDALLRSSGFRRTEFMKLAFRDLLRERFEALREDALTGLKTAGRFGPFDANVSRADGSAFPARIEGLRIKNATGRALIWTLINDISEQRRAEQMKNEFITTVSHELRTPLTSVAGSLKLLASGVAGALSERAVQLVDIANRNTDQLQMLINDLLDMEKLASGNLSVLLEEHPLQPLVESAVAQLRTYAADRDVSVVLQGSDNPVAHTDALRLTQALNNLLSNAIKYSPEGGTVSVRVAETNGAARISVSDQGPGIAAAFRAHVFEKFAQAAESRRKNLGGTGLGLAITQAIMEQLGGRVWFESEPGHGATFWLEVPVADPAVTPT